MERADRIKALQAALDNVNAAIPILQQGVDNGDTRLSELMEAKNRRDDLAALIADMPDDGALTELSDDDVAQLGSLERVLDASIRDNALINATLEGRGSGSRHGQ